MTAPQHTFTLDARGAFSLAESATFGFGQRDDPGFDGVMRLAFRLDGGFETGVGVELRQDGTRIQGVARGAAPDQLAAVAAQVARVLSLDHDASGYDVLADRDPVVASLMAAAPGLRPPLFYSPYEAAAWAVLSARRPRRQMAQLRTRLARAHGRTFELAGVRLSAFPAPSVLASLTEFAGIPAEKLERLHGVADQAQAGRLEAACLLELGPAAAQAELQRLRGVGPFYSQLVIIRGCGFTDVLPVSERHLLSFAGQLYQLGRPATDAELTDIADTWRPWRTWVSVLIRVAAPRILGPSGSQSRRPAPEADGPAGLTAGEAPHPAGLWRTREYADEPARHGPNGRFPHGGAHSHDQ
jgi:DNA-3-methyladenine glycosylase II